jgi:ATP-dependent RNA helicase SUPV3L1/SUV3
MPEVQALARDRERVALLWEVCQIPDFRQLPFDDHFKLLAATYQQLCRPAGRLDRAWIEGHLRRLEVPEGDLETLLARMSAVRTWTYITAHREWVEDAPGWQTRTHDLEDRLSDALHHQLVQRFVDTGGRRGRSRVRGAAARSAGLRSLAAELAAKVPGVKLPSAETPAAAGGEADTWVEALVDAPHAGFAVQADGRILAGERVVGRLVRGADRLHPEVTVAGTLGGGARLRLQRRLLAFARDLVAELLAPLQGDARPPAGPELAREPGRHDSRLLGPAARGLLYQLEQSLGSIAAAPIREQLRELTGAERGLLTGRGIVLGRLAVHAPALLEPAALQKRWALCAAEVWPERLPPLPAAGALLARLSCDPAIPARVYEALGYPLLGGLPVRADEQERLGRLIASGAPPGRIAAALDLPTDQAAAFAAEARGALGLRPGRPPRQRRR